MKPVAVVAAIAATVLLPTVSEAKVNRYEVLEARCSQSNPRACVRYAVFARRKSLVGWQINWLYRIPGCESGWNPYAFNPSGSSGLYQFLPSTWRTTPYGWRSIWRAKWQALAAAWMVLRGRTGEWVCR